MSDFQKIKKSQENIKITMHKFFDFFSYPSKMINLETSFLLDRLFNHPKLGEYDKFSIFTEKIESMSE